MKKKHSSIDGFIPRRSGDLLGDLHIDNNNDISDDIPENKPLNSTGAENERPIGQELENRSLGRSDIDESLQNINESEDQPKKLSHRQRRLMAKRLKKPATKLHKVIKRTIIAIIIIIILAGGYALVKFINAGSNVFQGNFFDVIQAKALKQDTNGRSNFLILGTSEDDEKNPAHPGANLTDSMLIVSVDQKNKDIFMFSIPRDLLVVYGKGCSAGTLGKINAYFSCIRSGKTSEDEQYRLTKTQEFIGNIFGIDIQYGVHVNHTVIKEAVDAVGGVDVDIQGSNEAKGILDRNFDWRCNLKCYLVKYDNGIHHLDGEHALYLSMARGDVAPTYGLANSNFDREKNQQKILIALRDKAMSTGTLTNLSAVSNLIDAVGNNLRTNVQTSEIRTLMSIANDVKSSDIHTLSLIDSVNGQPPVMKGDGNPLAGEYNYGGIRSFIKKNLTNDPVIRESAPIVVLNGTKIEGLGQTKKNSMTAVGFNVTRVDNAPDGVYDDVEVYQIGTGNTGTADKLETMYGVTVKKTAPPITVNGDVRFVIIFGGVTT